MMDPGNETLRKMVVSRGKVNELNKHISESVYQRAGDQEIRTSATDSEEQRVESRQ
jgi:hypothetical protein